MEYRVFKSIDENLFNTVWNIRDELEKRTDIYLILPCETNNPNDSFHIEHGLKLRNNKQLELKTREKFDSNGQEYWSKKKLYLGQNFNINDVGSIRNILYQSGERRLADLLLSQPIISCYVDKVREKTSLAEKITQESAGLHLTFKQLKDNLQIGNDLHFETVCIEHPGSTLIEDKFIETLPYQYKNHTPMGYPEFLFRQYHQIINQQ